jgi:hypothetical protein
VRILPAYKRKERAATGSAYSTSLVHVGCFGRNDNEKAARLDGVPSLRSNSWDLENARRIEASLPVKAPNNGLLGPAVVDSPDSETPRDWKALAEACIPGLKVLLKEVELPGHSLK